MNMNPYNLIIVFTIIIISTVLHEVAHGYAAYFQGDTTAKDEGRLSLNPLVHLDLFTSVILPVLLYLTGGVVLGAAKPVPVDRRNLRNGEGSMTIVALAGPMMNLLIAFVMFMIGHFTGFLDDRGVIGFIFGQTIIMNLGFMAFNLIPIPPLDGSRVLYYFLSDRLRDVMDFIEMRMGILFVYLFLVIFGSALSTITYNVMVGILSVFYLLVGAA